MITFFKKAIIIALLLLLFVNLFLLFSYYSGMCYAHHENIKSFF